VSACYICQVLGEDGHAELVARLNEVGRKYGERLDTWMAEARDWLDRNEKPRP
jgi:hypothetical protein